MNDKTRRRSNPKRNRVGSDLACYFGYDLLANRRCGLSVQSGKDRKSDSASKDKTTVQVVRL